MFIIDWEYGDQTDYATVVLRDPYEIRSWNGARVIGVNPPGTIRRVTACEHYWHTGGGREDVELVHLTVDADLVAVAP